MVFQDHRSTKQTENEDQNNNMNGIIDKNLPTKNGYMTNDDILNEITKVENENKNVIEETNIKNLKMSEAIQRESQRKTSKLSNHKDDKLLEATLYLKLCIDRIHFKATMAGKL